MSVLLAGLIGVFVLIGWGEAQTAELSGSEKKRTGATSENLGHSPDGQRPGAKTTVSAPALFRPLVLTNFYNRLLASYPVSQSWGMVPRGNQNFDGVPFQMEGKIELTGLGAARNNSFYPTRISGLEVGAAVQRLHLIHGAGYADLDETPMASLVLHYAGGERRVLFIEYGVHVRNWYVERSESYGDLADERSKVIWTGNTSLNGSGTPLRLFKTSFENPLPHAKLQSIDLFSLFSRATPVIIAITIEATSPGSDVSAQAKTDAAPPTAETDETAYRTDILVRLIDGKTRRPIPRVPFAVSVTERAKTFRFGSYTNDQKGEYRVDYPPGRFQSFTIQAVASNYVPREVSFSADDSRLFPESFTLELERAGN